MAISKVVYEDENGNSSVWMNVTDDTVDSDLLVDGIQATKADGEKVQGEIPIMSSSDLMTSGATVVVPSGYYDVAASKSVASGSATTPATSITANPSISVNSSGLITATTSASQNITPTVSAGYVSVGTAGTVSVTGSNTSQLTTQSAKTVTPTESEQTAVASGRYTTGAVKVGAISSTYVGSGITQRDSSDLTASGATITAPAGYYSSSASKSISTTTHPNPTASINSSTGLVTASHTQGTGYVTGGTTTGTLQLSTQSATSITPTESSQTAVSAGKYTTGNVTVNAIPSDYIGSDIQQVTSAEADSFITTSGRTVTVSGGVYYDFTDVSPTNQYTVAIAKGRASVPNTTITANPTITVGSDGTISASVSGSKPVSPTISAGYVSSGTAGTISVSGSNTEQLSTQGATTITPTTSSQVAVPASTFTTGAVTVGAIPSQYIVPSGTLSIASNGAFDVASYASVNVEVSGGDELEQLITRQISGVYSNNTINYIGAYAFGHCRITEASFPAVSQIGTSAFASCPYMTTINFPSLTKIGDCAFNYCSVLTTINAPNVTSIGSSAFIRCSTLTTASFSLATDIGQWAFGYCYSLTEANLPVASRIADYTFYSCSMLTSVNVPLASYVWYSAFQYCSMLRKISLPVATNIGNYAFAYCSNLTSVILPIARSIGNYAFAYCTGSLTAISFPSVVSIGASAFFRCYNLATVTLPSASYIGSYAFASCRNLLSMVLLGSSVASLANWNAFMFTPISNSTASTGGVYGSIYVPLSLYNSYITATFWSTYSARIVGVEREFNEILTLPLSTGSEFNGLEYYLQTTGTGGILTEGETYHLEGTIIVNGTEYELDPSTTEFVAASGGTIAEVVCGNITLNFTLQSNIGYIDIWTTSGASITLQGKTTIFGENAIAIVHNWHV